MQMASRKEYAYYLRGSQIAIVQKDQITGDGQTLSAPGLNDVGVHGDLLWKSPIATVADGLEIEYAYSPKYHITQTNITHTTITGYRSNGGYLQIKGGSVNYDTTLDVDDFIVLRNAGMLNGLHKITAIENVDATKDGITLDTKYSGLTTWSTFEETVTLFYRVDVLNDEGDTIDVASYLTKALVYYVKARIAEDTGQMEGKEYFMREFRVMLEKHESANIWGPRMIASGPYAIK